MSEPRFTPGPWAAQDAREIPWAEYDWRIIHDDKIVAHVVNCYLIEENANAALIAAAPEMYALLERILLDVHWDRIAVSDRGSTFCAIARLLAKARGEVSE